MSTTPTPEQPVKKKFVYSIRRDGCNICTSWTAIRGCKHHNPQDFDKNEVLIKAIVQAVHGGRIEIVETTDFYEGVNATLIFLRQNNLLKKVKS